MSNITFIYHQGKFVKENASGLVLYAIDFDDIKQYCGCGTQYPAYDAIVNGYKNKETVYSCKLFNRT